MRTAPARWKPASRWWRFPRACGRSWPAAARLSARANRLAEAASGFAGPFLFPVAAAVAGLGDRAALAALDELLAAGLIRPGQASERYEFAHALARQAIYDRLSPSRQARMHRRLAHALETARARVPGRAAELAEVVAQYAGSRALPAPTPGCRPRSRPRTWRRPPERTRRRSRS